MLHKPVMFMKTNSEHLNIFKIRIIYLYMKRTLGKGGSEITEIVEVCGPEGDLWASCCLINEV